MKKQIVITLTESDKGWTGEIYGKVGNKKTDKALSTVTLKAPAPESVAVNLAYQIRTVQRWMEQIK